MALSLTQEDIPGLDELVRELQSKELQLPGSCEENAIIIPDSPDSPDVVELESSVHAPAAHPAPRKQSSKHTRKSGGKRKTPATVDIVQEALKKAKIVQCKGM